MLCQHLVEFQIPPLSHLNICLNAHFSPVLFHSPPTKTGEAHGTWQRPWLGSPRTSRQGRQTYGDARDFELGQVVASTRRDGQGGLGREEGWVG